MNQIDLDRLVGMTLADALMEIPDNEVIHIGSGTGFLFVGDKDTFEEDEEKINKECRERAIKMMTLYLDNIQKATHNIGEKRIKLEELKNRVDIIQNLCDKVSEMKDNLIPLPERTVREVYPRIQGDGVIILIQGTENGRYWYKSEYDKERVKWIKNVCGL